MSSSRDVAPASARPRHFSANLAATFVVAREAHRLRQGLPLLLVSGYSDSDAIVAALGTGIPLLRKPFDISALQASFEHALYKKADYRA